MSLALLQAGPLKPEIKLSRAISEFAAALDPKSKVELGVLRSQSSPTFRTVIELTKGISRDGNRQHGKSWRARFGPRLEPLLHRIQMFGKAGDILIGGSQNMIASGVWACVRVFLQLALGYFSFFDKLSLLWDRIGQSSLIHAKLAELFPSSRELQRYMCEYLTVVITFCHKALAFLKKSRMQQLAASFALSFDQYFENLETDTDKWAALMNGTVMALTAELQLGNKQIISSSFKILSTFVGDSNDRQQHETRVRLLRKLAPSQDEFEAIWRREQKKGSVHWIFKLQEYLNWKTNANSATLYITGSIGSGKTVLMANLVKDLYSASENTENQPIIASFFCQHQSTTTLDSDVILRSIAHQILRGFGLDEHEHSPLIYAVIEQQASDAGAVFTSLRTNLPRTRSYFVAIDALDECKPNDRIFVLEELGRLAAEIPLRLTLSARNQSNLVINPSLLSNHFAISMANEMKNAEIADFIDKQITTRGQRLAISTEMEEKIKITLTAAAQGMYLWVALQLDAIFPPFGGSLSTRDIVWLLENLPEDLAEAYNRALAKIPVKYYDARLFKLVAGAYRPLRLDELRAALNVTPCEAVWNPDSLEVSPQLLIWQGGGGLLELDEVNDAVLWIHHSALFHLLENRRNSKEDLEASPVRRGRYDPWCFNLSQARLLMGMTCVTYLSLDIHDRRVQVLKPKLRIESAFKTISNSIAPGDRLFKAVWSIATRSSGGRTTQVDINAVLENLRHTPIAEEDEPLKFLDYSQEFWLPHTRKLLAMNRRKDTVQRYQSLFRHLLSPETHVAVKPWEPRNPRSAIQWAMCNDHISVLSHFASETFAGGFPRETSQTRDETKQSLFALVDIASHSIKPHQAGGEAVGTILSWAIIHSVSSSDEHAVRRLLELGANPNHIYCQDSLGEFTLLQLAVQPWLKSTTKETRENFQKWKFIDLYQKTRTAIVELLLRHNASPFDPRGEPKSSPLCLAIENGWFSCATTILKSMTPAECQTCNTESFSLLEFTIESLADDVWDISNFMQALFKRQKVRLDVTYWHENHLPGRLERSRSDFHGFPEILAMQEKPPIIVAIVYGLWNLALALIEAGAKPDTHWMDITLLGISTSTASRQIASFDSCEGFGTMALTVIEKLSLEGANWATPSKTIYYYDEPPEIPLHIALIEYRKSWRSRQHLFLHLLDLLIGPHPGSVTSPSANGLPALGQALESRCLYQIRFFLEHGADPNHKYVVPGSDSKHWISPPSELTLPLLEVMKSRPVLYKESYRTDAVVLLLQYGASPNVQVDGLTVLGHAIRLRCVSVIKLLYENYKPLIDTARVDEAGHSALQLAAKYGGADLFRLVASYDQPRSAQSDPSTGVMSSCPVVTAELPCAKGYQEKIAIAALNLFTSVRENDTKQVCLSLEELSRKSTLLPWLANIAMVRAIERFTAIDLEIVKQLIKYGVDLRAPRDVPFLILAIANGKLDIALLLLQNGALVACSTTVEYQTIYLRTQGASNDAAIGSQYVQISSGSTPKMVAREAHLPEIQQYLVSFAGS